MLDSRRRTRRIIRDLGARPPAVLDWQTGAVHVVDSGPVTSIVAKGRLSDVLELGARIGVDRVLIVGVESPALLAEWSTSSSPPGWTPAAHYLEPNRPVLTYDSDAGRVSIGTAAAWCGDVDEVEHVAHGLELTLEAIADAFPGKGQLLASPATTGRELAARCVPEGEGFPVLSDEMQELIRSTTTQHRMETTQPPGMQLPGLVELDMRLAYGALCWGLPTGVPTWHRGEPDGWRPQTRGRFLCTWRVPDDWSHVGLLPAPTADGWRWADRPGEVARGWLDGAELALARGRGWPVDIVECFTFPDGGPDPLRAWADKLAQGAAELERAGDVGKLPRQASRAARAAMRAILVHGLGALHGTPRVVTHTIADGVDETPPPGAPYRVVWETGAVVWDERRPPAWPEMAHPEWTAAVWARARCRLLTGPGKLGALALPRARVIAFRGDAIYATHDPGWKDSGRAGGWRTKGDPIGSFTMPETLPELDVVRRRGVDPVRGLAAARAALGAAR